MTAPAQEVGADKALAAYLTPGDVAQLLQVSVKSVYRWAKADPFMPALKIEGTLRFPRERLERWLRSREQGAGRPRQSRKPSLGVRQVHEMSDARPGVSAACAHPCDQEEGRSA